MPPSTDCSAVRSCGGCRSNSGSRRPAPADVVGAPAAGGPLRDRPSRPYAASPPVGSVSNMRSMRSGSRRAPTAAARTSRAARVRDVRRRSGAVQAACGHACGQHGDGRWTTPACVPTALWTAWGQLLVYEPFAQLSAGCRAVDKIGVRHAERSTSGVSRSRPRVHTARPQAHSATATQPRRDPAPDQARWSPDVTRGSSETAEGRAGSGVRTRPSRRVTAGVSRRRPRRPARW